MGFTRPCQAKLFELLGITYSLGITASFFSDNLTVWVPTGRELVGEMLVSKLLFHAPKCLSETYKSSFEIAEVDLHVPLDFVMKDWWIWLLLGPLCGLGSSFCSCSNGRG